MSDDNTTEADPTVHWIVYDIPATATSLPQGVPTDADIANPAGAKNGLEDSVTGRERDPLESRGNVFVKHL